MVKSRGRGLPDPADNQSNGGMMLRTVRCQVLIGYTAIMLGRNPAPHSGKFGSSAAGFGRPNQGQRTS